MLSRLMKRGRREASIEGTCREHAEARGYMLVKITTIVGFPDRLLVLPKSHVVFIEFKQPGEALARIQKHRARELEWMDHRTYRIDTVGAFDNLMDDLESEWKLRNPRPVRRRLTEAGWIDI